MKKSLALVAAAFTVAGAFAPTLAHAEGAKLPEVVDNEGTPISGGTLKVAWTRTGSQRGSGRTGAHGGASTHAVALIARHQRPMQRLMQP